MRAATKITFFNEDGEKFFGEGPARLLRGVERTGSLRAASNEMNMAYTKALKLIKNAEAALGFPLTVSTVGGRSGGGSRLTAEGAAWLERYEKYRDACIQANRKLYEEHFPDQNGRTCDAADNIGCVIMASGLGKRFGSNKLLTDFDGEPMICRILDATEGIFAKRVVVTRHEEIAKLCRRRGIEAVLHHLPHRNDTVRLGLEAVGDVERCMFCAGDQPLLKRETVMDLALASAREGRAIWRAAFKDTPGSPVVFPGWTFDQLRTLPEGKGGGFVIKQYPNEVRLVQVQDEFELYDVDEPCDIDMLLKKRRERCQ